jgi:dolichyl-phosphate-mannose-protein mannosyltransferase
MLVAAVVRLWNLDEPHKLVFDETYYVKDAWTLSAAGHELSWPKDPNAAFEAGDVNTFLNSPSYVVHPPLGKWLIAIGMRAFGAQNSFGWRISAALFGIALVWLSYQVAKRVLESHRWGMFVALLVAIDGEAIVLSRISILDGFLAFFALLGFYFMLRDLGSPQESLWRRPWLISMALALGAASAVKWSGIYFLAVFAIYVLGRYVFETRDWAGSVKKAISTFLLTVPVALATYVLAWAGWFLSSGAWGRNLDTNPLVAFWKYHVQMYQFHVGLSSHHDYQANPLTWLFMTRPTSFYYEGCGSGCSTAITALGNPAIWWVGAVAVILLTLTWLVKRDRTTGLVLLGLAAGYLPWFGYLNRTVFEFYTIAFFPFIVMAIALVFKRGIEEAYSAKRARGWVVAYISVALAMSVFFLPLWLGLDIPYWYWRAHMWLPSWI